LLYVGYLLIATLYPFEWSSGPILSRLPEFVHRLQRGNTVFFTGDFVANILLFVPFGMIACLHFAGAKRRKGWPILVVALLGCLLSFSVEFVQFFVRNRHSSITDVISNGTGALAGAVVVASLPSAYIRRWFRAWHPRLTWPILLAIAAILALVPLAMPIVFPNWHLAQLWSGDARFHAGNNTSLTRPWYGDLHRIAIYSRALNEECARRHLSCMQKGTHVASDAAGEPIALYEFSPPQRSGLADKTGQGGDLHLEGSGRLRWRKTASGVHIRHPARLSTGRLTGSRITDKLRNSQEFSVEVWFAPRNLIQKGPALIFNLAGAEDSTNFLLGQSSRDLVFWVRTPVSGLGLSALSATTMNQPLTRKLTQAIVVFREGRLKIFVNGVLSGSLDLRRESLPGMFTKRTNGARIAYAFFYFFPFTLAWSSFLARRNVPGPRSFLSAAWVAPALAVILLLVAEILHCRQGGREFDLTFLALGVLVIFAAATAARFSSPAPR